MGRAHDSSGGGAEAFNEKLLKNIIRRHARKQYQRTRGIKTRQTWRGNGQSWARWSDYHITWNIMGWWMSAYFGVHVIEIQQTTGLSHFHINYEQISKRLIMDRVNNTGPDIKDKWIHGIMWPLWWFSGGGRRTYLITRVGTANNAPPCHPETYVVIPVLLGRQLTGNNTTGPRCVPGCDNKTNTEIVTRLKRGENKYSRR